MIIFLKIPEKKSETIFLVNFNQVFNKNTVQKELCEELVTTLNLTGKNIPSWFFLTSMLHLTQLTTNSSSIDWFISRHLRESARISFHVCQTEVFCFYRQFSVIICSIVIRGAPGVHPWYHPVFLCICCPWARLYLSLAVYLHYYYADDTQIYF